jgi:hypothetical protein
MIFGITLALASAIIFPPWLMYKHCSQMDTDPEYRRRARERGW